MRIRPGDKAKIMKAAKRSGISVAEYVVQCCKAHPPKEKPPDEFWNLLNELYTVFDELSPEAGAAHFAFTGGALMATTSLWHIKGRLTMIILR